ncbi:MAG: hypothetical protein M1829_001209 [Trizodia sp. TS-e1964]|nr:MAG: hypothetical protein M1829_001209 [Trizodia sp. TS-e1964]
MFSPSVTRIARSGLQVSLNAPARGLSTAASITSRSFTPRSRHGRRASSSSSKRSDPLNGAKAIAQASGVPSEAPGAKQAGEKRPASRLGRRKSNAHANLINPPAVAPSLPRVPSTQHLHPAQILVSAFFSLHRPISVTAGLPPTATHNAFLDIFSPRTRASAKHSEVISTLSASVDSMNSLAMQAPNDTASVQGEEQGDEASDALSRYFSSTNLSPFMPPPPPSPAGIQGVFKPRGNEVSSIKHKTYSTVLTIVESTHPNGDKTYSTSVSDLVSSDDTAAEPTSFLERMRVRQMRWEQSREEPLVNDANQDMVLAISVKRQRKLKMKKHKYKKLMRRTRNLRRRLDKN